MSETEAPFAVAKVNVADPSATREFAEDPEWIEFNGTYELAPPFVRLHPIEDARITITVDASDVRTEGTVLPWLRLGSRARAVEIPEDSPVKERTNAETSSTSKCGGNKTMCVGGAEHCCHDYSLVGYCRGHWTCI